MAERQPEAVAVPSATLWRRKARVFEAMRWDGSPESATAIINWILASDETARFHDEPLNTLVIDIPGGTVIAMPGDWVTVRADGVFWPLEEADFLELCEPVGVLVQDDGAGRERAETAEAKLAAIADLARSWAHSATANEFSGTVLSVTVLADAGRSILAIIGTEGDGGRD